jgi:hypothetical protein
MLPDMLYKSLPYLYIAAGVFFGIVIESNIVFISSALLMTAGFLVLWMRHHPLEYSDVESVPEVQGPKTENWDDIFQAEDERRLPGIARTFPLIDDSGCRIAFDRRLGEQGMSGAV